MKAFCSAWLATVVSVAAAASAQAGGVTMAHSFPDGHPVATWAEDFARCMEDNAGLHLEVIGGGALGGPRDIVEGVTFGHLSYAIVPAWALSPQVDGIDALSVPGVAGSPSSLAERSGSDAFVDAVDEMTRDAIGASVLAVGWDFSALVGTRNALENPGGHAIRPNSPGTEALFRSIGIDPVPLSSREVFSALSVGITDGAILPTETASTLVKDGLVEAALVGDDYAPFASPYLLVMGADFGGSIDLSMGGAVRNCRESAQTFTETNYKALLELQSDANALGVDTLDTSGVLKRLWGDTLLESSASLGAGFDGTDSLSEALSPNFP